MVNVRKQKLIRRSIQAGVSQGSDLGPILYSSYTNNIPDEDYAWKALFADDTAVNYAHCRDSERIAAEQN